MSKATELIEKLERDVKVSSMEALKRKFKKGEKVKTNDGFDGKITKAKDEFGAYGPESVYWVDNKGPYSEDELEKAK